MKFIQVTKEKYKDPNTAVSTHHPERGWSWEPATPDALYPNLRERVLHWLGYHISFGQPYCVICLLAESPSDYVRFGRESAFKDVLAWLDTQPQDFCNDGHYSDAQMVKCLTTVIRSGDERLRAFLKSQI